MGGGRGVGDASEREGLDRLWDVTMDEAEWAFLKFSLCLDQCMCPSSPT